MAEFLTFTETSFLDVKGSLPLCPLFDPHQMRSNSQKARRERKGKIKGRGEEQLLNQTKNNLEPCV